MEGLGSKNELGWLEYRAWEEEECEIQLEGQ